MSTFLHHQTDWFQSRQFSQFCILQSTANTQDTLKWHAFQRALAAAIWQVPPDWKWPTGRPSQTALGSVQLRQTLAHWTSASRLPGERPLLEMNGNILWTQQCSSGVHYERKNTNGVCFNAEWVTGKASHFCCTTAVHSTIRSQQPQWVAGLEQHWLLQTMSACRTWGLSTRDVNQTHCIKFGFWSVRPVDSSVRFRFGSFCWKIQFSSPGSVRFTSLLSTSK